MRDHGRPSLAERKRQLVHDELSEAALRLFARQGFEDTTIDQIVAAAGVSRRTFFRYFRSKEDVIVEFLGILGDQLHAGLAARPATEPLSVAVRAALAVFEHADHQDPRKAFELARLTIGTPALRARYLDRRHQWQQGLTAMLADRAGLDPVRDLRPALTAAVALGTFDTALTCWVRGDGARPLGALLDEAFALVAEALDTLAA